MCREWQQSKPCTNGTKEIPGRGCVKFGLLYALELVGAVTGEGSNSTGHGGWLPALQRFKVKFSTLTWILFIVFIPLVIFSTYDFTLLLLCL